MPFIIKFTSLALKEFPILNSSIDNNLENLIYKVFILLIHKKNKTLFLSNHITFH